MKMIYYYPLLKKKEVKSETEKTIGKKAKLVVKRENKCEQESKYLIQTNY